MEKVSGVVLFLFAMAVVLIASLDIYVPISPQLAEIFSVSETVMRLTFLIGPLASGLIGIPIGFFSDRKGRRPMLITGLISYILGTLLCALSDSITLFFIGRFVQSLGVGALLVLSSTILADLFSGISLARILGLYALLFPITFTLAPLVGAQVYTLLGWQAIFWLLLLCMVPISIMLIAYLPETCKTSSPDNMMPLIKKMASSKLVLSLALAHAVPITIGLIFTANGAFLYHNLFNFNPVSLSIVQAIPVGVQCLGTMIYRRVVEKSGLKSTLQMGSWVAGTYSLVCLLMIFHVFSGPWMTVSAVCLFTFGSTFIIASTITLLLDCMENNKGLTVSFLNLVKNFVIAVVISGASFLSCQSVVPIFTVMLLISLVTLLLIFFVLRELEKRESPDLMP